MTATLLALPDISPAEWADMEREAGRPFLSLEQVTRYRLRRTLNAALDTVLSPPPATTAIPEADTNPEEDQKGSSNRQL